MKKLLISAMIAACLITTMAQAQTYNATGSERQAASNDMGMYQLTLEAFRSSQYYLNPQNEPQRLVREAIDTSSFGVGKVILVNAAGQISPPWPDSGPYRTEDTRVTLSKFIDAAKKQRIIYLSLSDIAEQSFPAIRSKKMNRKASVIYLRNQIDLNFQSRIEKYIVNEPNLTQMSSSTAQTDIGVGGYVLGCGTSVCPPAVNQGWSSYGRKYAINGVYEWTAVFEDGSVLKSNYGQVDLSNRGRPWFSEAAIKGEKLSIAGSSDRGSSTSQKRGE